MKNTIIALICLVFLIILGVVFNDILKEEPSGEIKIIENSEIENRHFLHFRGLEEYNLQDAQTGDTYILKATRINENEVGLNLIPLK